MSPLSLLPSPPPSIQIPPPLLLSLPPLLLFSLLLFSQANKDFGNCHNGPIQGGFPRGVFFWQRRNSVFFGLLPGSLSCLRFSPVHWLFNKDEEAGGDFTQHLSFPKPMLPKTFTFLGRRILPRTPYRYSSSSLTTQWKDDRFMSFSSSWGTTDTFPSSSSSSHSSPRGAVGF